MIVNSSCGTGCGHRISGREWDKVQLVLTNGADGLQEPVREKCLTLRGVMDLPATAEPRLVGEKEDVHLTAVGFNAARRLLATEFTNLSPFCLDLMRKTCTTGTESHVPLCPSTPASVQTKFPADRNKRLTCHKLCFSLMEIRAIKSCN